MNEHEHSHDVSANTLFGFWVYLMTDCILFATLFAAYAVLRDATFGGPSGKELFSLRDALASTLLLAASSFTCGLAMLQIQTKKLRHLVFWFAATFILGLCFLWMVNSEFARLVASGNGWGRNAFLTSYFTLIGTHALHIAFGLLFIIVFVAQAIRWGLTPMVVRRLSCLKLFWFFSYLIWIFMFTIVYLIGARNTESDSKIGRWHGGAPHLSQENPALKQPNLNQLDDGTGFECRGCSKQPIPILESGAV